MTIIKKLGHLPIPFYKLKNCAEQIRTSVDGNLPGHTTAEQGATVQQEEDCRSLRVTKVRQRRARSARREQEWVWDWTLMGLSLRPAGERRPSGELWVKAQGRREGEGLKCDPDSIWYRLANGYQEVS